MNSKQHFGTGNAQPIKFRTNHFLDNIHTTIFTPSEHQVELLDASKKNNIVVCLASSSSQVFIVVMLVKELAYQIRGPRPTAKRSLIAINSALALKQYLEMVQDHSDLKVAQVTELDTSEHKENFRRILEDHYVVIMYVEHLVVALRCGLLEFSTVNLLVVDECHYALRSHPCRELLKLTKSNGNNSLRILGLSTSVLGKNCDPCRLEERLLKLEKSTSCMAGTSSGLVLLSCYSAWPEVIVVECSNNNAGQVDAEILAFVNQAKQYLLDHVYRPEDIYEMSDDDEMPSIPDPTVAPLSFLSDLVYILEVLGPWCADRAAWFFMKELKKHKDKTPYERHYLLLSMVYTVMESVRAICDYHFRGLDEKDRMVRFASPKVLRLLEVLRHYKPKSQAADVDRSEAQAKCGGPAGSGDSSERNDHQLNSVCDYCQCLQYKNSSGEEMKNANRDLGVEVTNKSGVCVKCCRKLNETSDRCPVILNGHPEPPASPARTNHQSRHSYGRSRYGYQRTRGIRHFRGSSGPGSSAATDDPNSLWCIVFIERRYVACVLNMFLKEASKQFPDLAFITPNFIMGQRQVSLSGSGLLDPKEAQLEHRKQEEVLRRFRTHECNVLIATSVVEEGVDLPKCNLVVRFDAPRDYRSYTQSKGRAKAIPSRFLLLFEKHGRDDFLRDVGRFCAIEDILLSRCHGREVPVDEEVDLDVADRLLAPYRPCAEVPDVRATMSSAISIVNRYCARLPSDTFTRLVPRCSISNDDSSPGLYSARLSLPINSPVKCPVVGPPMLNVALAKMAAALRTVQVLHKCGELDDNLLPVGKVCTKKEIEIAFNEPVQLEEETEVVEEGCPRPGTTKRRQYYNKRIAQAFTRCLPVPSHPAYLYHITMKLTCPIPEEQNVRGRQIYEPADVSQGFGILTSTAIPEICGFPVFTRSGEVRVKLAPVASGILLGKEQLDKLYFFHWYTFTNVLRLEKYPMCFDLDGAENSILIVPVNRGDRSCDGDVSLDWDFVEEIVAQRDRKPSAVPEEERRSFLFDETLYKDAVVMPWYRNLDQPQYFYVAEVCRHLSPHSDFPDDDFETFDNYYHKKYGIRIQNHGQPLLDVDHTSARLNLLTPRYVNRKGVALPTSSEETKRAKRENLQQKQILVPELCTIHRFSASLWRKAVCLPCILYRLNSLLLADELRIRVAVEIGLGSQVLVEGHQWPDLDFGWSLADVVKARQLAAEEKAKKLAAVDRVVSPSSQEKSPQVSPLGRKVAESSTATTAASSCDDPSAFRIGTWSNEMANLDAESDLEGDLLPDDILMLGGGVAASERSFVPVAGDDDGDRNVRYGSPSNFEGVGGWDVDNELQFDVMDIPGFGFISAPGGGFHMENLSRDLEAFESNILATVPVPQAEQRERHSSKNSGGTAAAFYGNYYADDNDEEEEEEDDEDFDDDDDSEQLASKHACGLGDVEVKSSVGKEWVTLFDWESAVEDDERDDECIRRLPATSDLVSRALEKIRIVGCDEPLRLVTQDGLRRKPKNEDLEEVLTRKSCDTTECVDEVALATSPPASPRLLDTSDIRSAPVILGGDGEDGGQFAFDYQPDLGRHPGPSPSVLLQALTMSNANDGINLERLETIGDSFLKHAITTYLYCMYPNVHEGKLSHLRSKQVSNLKLYQLGRRKGFAHFMIATKFEPNDNWLPPGYIVPKELEQALIDSGIPCGYWNIARLPRLGGDGTDLDPERIRRVLAEHGEEFRRAIVGEAASGGGGGGHQQQQQRGLSSSEMTCFIPYNLMTQHSIPDKSIADCVEAQIGAYLTSCGPRGALLFMSWLGVGVLPRQTLPDGTARFGYLRSPPSPLQANVSDARRTLELLLDGYDQFEANIGYKFIDKSYLLQAFTHASYHYNRLTDCYQRLEFLGDAVLDYLITRHLYEDKRQHSPGTLTDLRSALVNNTIFATLAVRYDFHKYFKALCPNLFLVIDRFVRTQKENNHRVSEDFYFMEEEECEEVEDIEVPKALGDVFESVAGAIYLDSGMSLDTVWNVYYGMMKSEIELFSTSVPKSPIRELLEKEPETAKFGKPERTLDGKVRVTVEVFGKGRYTALGRNYRIAKCTAAKHALKALRKLLDNPTSR